MVAKEAVPVGDYSLAVKKMLHVLIRRKGERFPPTRGKPTTDVCRAAQLYGGGCRRAIVESPRMSIMRRITHSFRKICAGFVFSYTPLPGGHLPAMH